MSRPESARTWCGDRGDGCPAIFEMIALVTCMNCLEEAQADAEEIVARCIERKIELGEQRTPDGGRVEYVRNADGTYSEVRHAPGWTGVVELAK